MIIFQWVNSDLELKIWEFFHVELVSFCSIKLIIFQKFFFDQFFLLENERLSIILLMSKLNFFIWLQYFEQTNQVSSLTYSSVCFPP